MCHIGIVWPAATVDVSTRQLRSFVAVAEELHFTRAAARVFVTQQTLSAHVARVEGRVGVALLDRTSRRVALTPAGEVLYERASAALRVLDEGVAAARQAEPARGRSLRVGFLPGAALELTAPILATFRETFPDVAVRLVERGYGDPSVGLGDGSADVAFVRPPIATAGVELAVLFTEPRVAAVAESHPFAQRASVTAADVLGEALLAPGCADPVFRSFWLLGDACGDTPSRVTATTTSAIEEMELVAGGDVCDVTTEGARRFAARPGLAYVAIEGVAGSDLAVGWINGDLPLVKPFVHTALTVRDREHELVRRITSAT